MKTAICCLCLSLMPVMVHGQSVAGGNVSRTPQTVGRLVINELLARPDFMMYNSTGARGIHYAEACAGFGAVRLAGALKDTALLEKLAARYALEKTRAVPNSANHVDVNVYGILPLELYRVGMGRGFLEEGLKLADGQWQDTLPVGLTSQARFWIDDIWMIGSLQIQAYRATGDNKYLQRAAEVIDAYIKNLQQPDGLFFHGNNGPFYWGRGNGWVAAGLAELLSELPESDARYSFILGRYCKMMKTLLRYQAEDGMWRQLIDREESFKETSATAMFGYAMTVGVRKGLLPGEIYGPAIDRAWNALTQYIDARGMIREVCVGTEQSTDLNFYLTRPRVTGDLHGQAPLLWFAYEYL